MAENENSGLNRREFLRKAAITGAVAWAVPVIQSVAATPAYAFHQGSPHPCPHSFPEGSGESCMGTCQAKCTNCSGPGQACNVWCNSSAVCQPGDVCCENACNPGAWTCGPNAQGQCVATFAGC
jgi:hypothetical protein